MMLGSQSNMKNVGIIIWGGLGDALLVTPALRTMKREHKEIKITVFCDPIHEPILRNNPNIDRLKLSGSGVGKKELRRLIREMDDVYKTEYAKHKPSINNSAHATSLIGKMLGVNVTNCKLQLFFERDEEVKAINFLSLFKFPVIICVNSTNKNKDWPISKWRELVSKINGVDFIQIGKKNDTKIEGCIDMRGKTSLREAFSIVKYSKLIVAVDSVWNHVSNAVDTKGIILWGPGNPVVWGYASNINIYKCMQCSPCIDTNIDSCHKNDCMDSIEVIDIINEIYKTKQGCPV